MGFASYRRFKPLPSQGGADTPGSANELAARLEHGEKIDQIHEALIGVRGSILELRTSMESLERAMFARIDLEREHADSRFQNLQLALAAIWHRERLDARTSEIGKLVTKLHRPPTVNALTGEWSWNEWVAAEREWREALEKWCALAEPYMPNARECIHETPAERFKQDFDLQDTQFPDTTVAVTYRTFRIIHSNWERVLDVVMNRVRRAAYGGEGLIVRQEAQG